MRTFHYLKPVPPSLPVPVSLYLFSALSIHPPDVTCRSRRIKRDVQFPAPSPSKENKGSVCFSHPWLLTTSHISCAHASVYQSPRRTFEYEWCWQLLSSPSENIISHVDVVLIRVRFPWGHTRRRGYRNPSPQHPCLFLGSSKSVSGGLNLWCEMLKRVWAF